jgi:hypothetical protein|tara:strand:+ start:52 stop:474 length:423 start_codon:yes stop_codon:yes gene_type:complete
MEPIERKITELEMNVRAYNAFLSYAPEITTIRDLVLKTEGELLRMPNFGRKSLNEVKENLSLMGLRLGMTEKQLPKRMEDISTNFSYNVLNHASEAAIESLDVILKKQQWRYSDIEKYFREHEKIMETYKQALERLKGTE